MRYEEEVDAIADVKGIVGTDKGVAVKVVNREFEGIITYTATIAVISQDGFAVSDILKSFRSFAETSDKDLTLSKTTIDLGNLDYEIVLFEAVFMIGE